MITESVNRCLSLHYILMLFFVLYILVWVAGVLAMALVVGLVVKNCGGVECVNIETIGSIYYTESCYWVLVVISCLVFLFPPTSSKIISACEKPISARTSRNQIMKNITCCNIIRIAHVVCAKRLCDVTNHYTIFRQ